jgi:hypothetical protein
VSNILKAGGRFVFTLDHPLKEVAYVQLGIELDLIKEYERYLENRLRRNWNNWTKKQNDLEVYIRPFGTYINAAGRNGLLVKAIAEPETRTMHGGLVHYTPIPFKMAIEVVKP